MDGISILFSRVPAIYFLVMSFEFQQSEIQVVGVSLSGRDGRPLIVFECPGSGDFLPLAVSPFDAETVIRDFTGDGESTAVAWLEDLLVRRKPRRAVLVDDGDDGPALRLDFRRTSRAPSRRLAVGEGLALVRRLDLSLLAEDRLFRRSREELAHLARGRGFRENFLYLTPPQFAPNIPLE